MHVDVVIGMAENTPIVAIKKLMPQLWVKGNRTADTVVELETVHGYGGVYVALWTAFDQSSTGYIQEAHAVYEAESKMPSQVEK